MKNKLTSMRGIVVLSILFMGLGGLAWAYFSSSATSSNNSFETGSLEVVLSDDDENDQQSVSTSWGAENIMPGAFIPEKVITIKNNSSTNAHHIDIEFDYTGDEEVAKHIIMSGANNGFKFGWDVNDTESVNLRTNLNGGSDVDYVVKGPDGGSLQDADGADGSPEDGYISIAELAALGKFRIEPGQETAPMDAGSVAYLWLNAKADNELEAQNSSIDVSITFTLDQDSSQF